MLIPTSICAESMVLPGKTLSQMVCPRDLQSGHIGICGMGAASCDRFAARVIGGVFGGSCLSSVGSWFESVFAALEKREGKRERMPLIAFPNDREKRGFTPRAAPPDGSDCEKTPPIVPPRSLTHRAGRRGVWGSVRASKRHSNSTIPRRGTLREDSPLMAESSFVPRRGAFALCFASFNAR